MLPYTIPFFLSTSLIFAASYPVLTYSTYLRDSFTPKAIATDAAGNVYMTGTAIVDPSTSQNQVLVVKLNPQGTQYLYVRYLGGSVNDYANAISVDSAGNAYIAGSTASPDFPVTAGGNLGAPAAGQSNQRSFVAKLDPNGELLFSDLLGGSADSSALAVAVNTSGQIVVTGEVSGANGPSFPSTAGAYSVATTANHPYLLEIDPMGTKIIFSATGIGGSALALDSSSNIYVAGTTYLSDYPTTPGAYQTTFPTVNGCLGPCMFTIQGANQYISKIDPTGAKLLYSTALTGVGNTINAGLAVDASGSAYVTGYAGAGYPFTVTPPAIVTNQPVEFSSLPFLSKLDPTGATLLFSVPTGGAGVELDSHGAVYAGGGLGNPSGYYFVQSNIPALASVPSACLSNGTLILNSAYVAQVDASSGNVLGTQYIWGSTLVPSSIALAGSTAWIAGSTQHADVPFTSNALTPPAFGPGPLAGAYVGAVDFSQPQPAAGAPQIGCIIDSADYALAGPAARYQMLTIIGTNLGPATGVSASSSTTTSLAGVFVNFGLDPAPLLYVSSTQINFAMPLLPLTQSFAALQLNVNGVSAPMLQIPLTYANPSLFINGAYVSSFGYVVTALNADGSLNSATNPAQLGSQVSVFANGLTQDPGVNNAPLQLFSTNGWSIKDTAQTTPFLLQVNLEIPSQLQNNFACATSGICATQFSIYDGEQDFGPPPLQSQAIPPLTGVVYVNRGQ